MFTIVFKDKTVVHASVDSSEQIPNLFTDNSVLAVISCDVATVEVLATDPKLEEQTNVTYCTVFEDGTTVYLQNSTTAFALNNEVVLKFTNSVNLYSMTVARNPIKLQRQLDVSLESYRLHSYLQVGDIVRILEELPPDLKVVVDNQYVNRRSFLLSGTESLIIRGTREIDEPIRWSDHYESFTH